GDHTPPLSRAGAMPPGTPAVVLRPTTFGPCLPRRACLHLQLRQLATRTHPAGNRPRMKTYTVRQLREFLTVLYGGTQRHDGWYPRTTTVAKRRHVHPSSVRRWIKGELDDPAPIPQARLRLLLRGYQVTTATRTRERHEQDRLEVMSQRQRLGRGRGNLEEYRRLGWLDGHSGLIIEGH